MLQILRDRASGLLVKSVLWALVIAFVGTIFLVWGYGSDKREAPVAQVAGTPITQAEYRRYYESMVQNLRQMLGGQQFSSDMIKQFNVEKSAMDSAIMEHLVVLAAQDAGVLVSDDELRYSLENNKDFQRDGKFDKEVFVGVLRANKIAPREFEKLMRRELLAKKMTRLIADTVPVTEQEIRDAFITNNEQLKIRFVPVTRAAVASKVKIDDKALEDYLKKTAFRFMLPEQRKVERITAHPEDFRSEKTVTDSVVELFYKGHKNEFVRKDDEVRARHILIETPKNPTPKAMAEAAQNALSILDKLKKGADFAETAKKYSNDPGTAKLGGDLGFFQRGRMVPEFDKAAFELPVGKLSDLVKSNYGWHIIKVEEKHAAGPMKYEEVAKTIKDTLVNNLAKLEAQRRISLVLADKSGKPLADIAKAQGLNAGAYTVRSGEQVEKLKGSEPLVKRIFELKKGETAGPLEASGAIHIIHLVDIIPPHQPQLSEVRKDVEDAFRKDEESRLAGEMADKILKETKAGADLKTASKEIGAQPKESDLLKRHDNKIEGVAQASPLIEAAFALKPGAFDKVQVGDDWYVITAAEKKPADMATLDKERQKLRDNIFSDKGKAAVRDWQAALRKDAEKRGILKIEKKFDQAS